jgi:Spy/CpxP family protein refolding chaperone
MTSPIPTLSPLRRAARALLLVALVGGLLAPAFASAQRHDHERSWGERRGAPGAGFLIRALERHAERLKLEPRVLEQIRAIGERDRETMAPLYERKDREHARMRELLAGTSPDEARVLDQAEVLGAIETDLEKQRLRTLMQIRSLLSAEQLGQLAQIREERRGRKRHHGRGRRGGERLDLFAPTPQQSAPPAQPR